MQRILNCSLSLLAMAVVALSAHAAEPGPFADSDWPWWRGPQRDGTAATDQRPPLEWSETENILWQTPIPGRGFGSPIVVGERVFLATADEVGETRSLICLDRATGNELWATVVHQGKATPPRNKKGTQASSTPACDGERVFINFLHDGAMVTSALSVGGDILWQQKISDYVVHQGFGSSPTLLGALVIVSADNKSGGAIAGLNRQTGEIAWRHDRPQTPNYSSPVVLNVAGRRQLIMTGCDLVASFDPVFGKKLWEMPGATTECVTTTPASGDLIFTSGGYPKNHVAAVRADGSEEVVWENGTRVYVPSMLVKDGYLYATTDAGVAVCWKADTGEEQWKGRLGGTFSSSPVLVGKEVYATNESGRTFLFKATPDKFEKLGENQLGHEVFATPVIAGGRIYHRVAFDRDGERQEMLYCIGKSREQDSSFRHSNR